MARINPGRMMLDDGGGYEPLIAVAVQAAVASPAVVNTPANVAPKAAEVEKVITAVIKAVAPDDSDDRLRQIAKQATQAVVTNPAVIAAPAGKTVDTTTTQGIIAASIKMPYDSTKPATTVTMPFDGTTTPGIKNLDTTTLAGITAASGQPVPGTGGVVGGSSNAGAYASSGFPGADKNPVTGTKPDPKVTAYADLTPAQRAAMSQKEKMDYIEAARVASMASDATARAATDPMKNFAVRPEAPKKEGMIQYYSWIGGATSGQWKLYSAVDTPENQAKYGARSTGGATQATPESAVGANSLVNPPAWDPKTSTWKPATTTPTTTTPTTTTPTTTTPTTTTPTTTTPTTTTPTTTTPTTVTPTVPTGVNAETAALIKSLQDQIANLTKQVTDTTTTTTLEERQRKENALASLTSRFSKYGLESLIPKIKELVIKGSTESTIALELAETEEYKQRFKANTERLKKGLSVLDPGTYIGMEDSYRQALRAYGLKQFDTDDYVSQFISNDVSANELSNRIVTAVQRIQNADPAITKQLKDFYNIGQNDLVAYVLDPNQQFQKIERQVQAAEIGVAAARQGITAGVQVAEQLAAQGVTQAEAQKGYATIADILPDAKRLSDIYGSTLEGYDLGQAEQEVFNQLASAQRRRQKLTQREIAAFGGSSGTNKTSLTTSSVGQF